MIFQWVFFFFFFSFLADLLTNKKSSFSCSDRPISERVTIKTDWFMSGNSCFPNTSLCHAKGCSPFSPAVSAERLCCPSGLSPPYTGVCAVTWKANRSVPFNTHKDRRRTSWADQWLRLGASTTWDVGLIPNSICYVAQPKKIFLIKGKTKKKQKGFPPCGDTHRELHTELRALKSG